MNIREMEILAKECQRAAQTVEKEFPKAAEFLKKKAKAIKQKIKNQISYQKELEAKRKKLEAFERTPYPRFLLVGFGWGTLQDGILRAKDKKIPTLSQFEEMVTAGEIKNFDIVFFYFESLHNELGCWAKEGENYEDLWIERLSKIKEKTSLPWIAVETWYYGEVHRKAISKIFDGVLEYKRELSRIFFARNDTREITNVDQVLKETMPVDEWIRRFK